MADLYGQGDFGVRLDWGPAGARVTRADACVVVDVLSFSTSVNVAVERGTRVFPYRWTGGQAEEYALRQDAVLAVGRLEATAVGAVAVPTLSPARLLSCPPVPRLVLPSPNGSTIAQDLQQGDSVVAAGCLRNARAVAAWLAPTVRAAVDVFDAARHSLRERLHDCVGGRELTSKGFAADVEVAADLDASTVVPVLVDGAFTQVG